MGEDSAEKAKLAQNVQATAEKALEVLGHMEAALRSGGFASNAEQYRKMADLLLTQKLWADRMTSGELAAKFAEVGKTAASIYGILRPYQNAMSRLAVLGEPATGDATDPSSASRGDGSAPARPPEEVESPQAGSGNDLAASIISTLRSRPRGASVSWVQSRVQASKTEVGACLADLERQGRVSRHSSSGRVLYRLREVG